MIRQSGSRALERGIMAGGAHEWLALMWPGNSGDLVKFAGVVGVRG